jgi:nucleotide-binding universal stress UspA family protein
VKQIVVAVDTRTPIAGLLSFAVSLGHAFSAKLWIVHVAAPDPAFVGFRTGPQVVRDDRARELKAEQRILREASSRLRNEGLDAEVRMLEGDTVATLLAETSRLQADLIVLARHNRGRIARAFMGSVCEAVVRQSDCPVMVLPESRNDCT